MIDIEDIAAVSVADNNLSYLFITSSLIKFDLSVDDDYSKILKYVTSNTRRYIHLIAEIIGEIIMILNDINISDNAPTNGLEEVNNNDIMF